MVFMQLPAKYLQSFSYILYSIFTGMDIVSHSRNSMEKTQMVSLDKTYGIYNAAIAMACSFDYTF